MMYGVLVINQDRGVLLNDGTTLKAGEQLVMALNTLTYANGNPLLEVSRLDDRNAAETRLRNRDTDALLILPPDFSAALSAAQAGLGVDAQPVIFVGDLTNPYYAIAAVMVNAALDEFIQIATGQPRPLRIVEEPLGASAARTEFENYVPGLLVFAVIMLVFQISMAIAREVEAGTLRRLQLTRMSAFDLLGGTSAVFVLIGVISVLLTFAVAVAIGFRSQGPLWVAILIGAVTSLSIVGVGLIVVCFSKTVTQAFLIANFPLALFMFFSGVIYPFPRQALFTLAGHAVSLYDILPPTHAVVALNKVLTLGVGIGEVMYELIALLALSVFYFAIGVWLFQRKHLSTR
jgi:ABC-2 type transport system permease protein